VAGDHLANCGIFFRFCAVLAENVQFMQMVIKAPLSGHEGRFRVLHVLKKLKFESTDAREHTLNFNFI